MLVTTRQPRSSPITEARTTLPTREVVPLSSFQSVLRGYQQFGGLAGGDEVACRLRPRLDQPISTLARWIVNREVLMLPCESVLLLPLFQFDFESGRVKPAVTASLAELRAVFDDWDLACWFATPNTLLSATPPMAHVDGDGRAMFETARVDRFIATG